MGRIVSMALVVAAMVVSGATSAFAGPGNGNGGSTGGGYSVTAISFSGDAAPRSGGAVSAGVPATCWWEEAQLYRFGDASLIDITNPDELESWYLHELPKHDSGSFAMGRAAYGDLSLWRSVLDKMRAGEKITAYQPSCRQDAPDCALVGFSGTALPPGIGGPCGMNVAIGFFPTGNPPAPQIAPADLAQAARDEMNIPVPQVDRNPKVTALSGATLVGLPTWFWVTDPTSVGGTAGTRTIRAEVAGVWAQVVASTKGLNLTSPAGGARCGPGQALTRYARGVTESSACTVGFLAASVGYPDGFPVDASTSWSATWTGSGNTGGTLTPLQRGTVVVVPVAEVQTVVTGVG